MITEYECPKFEFNTFIDEFNNEKIFFEASEAKLIFDDDQSYDLSNIKVFVLDDIKLEFELDQKIINEYESFTVKFESSDAWLINIEKCYFTVFRNNYPTNAMGSSISILRGSCDKDSKIKYYNFIENLNLSNECEINELTCTSLNNLFLIKHNDNIFKNIDGYFFTKDTYQNLLYNKDVFINLYFLLKYYSAESASMRITYCVNEDFQKIRIKTPSHYSNFKYLSCFYDSYPHNIFNFLNSAYGSYIKLNNEEKKDINLLIHYLAFLRRERYMEVELLISTIILEVLTKNHDKIKDLNENTFRADLKELIKELGLDFNKLDKFFKEYGVACEKNNFLSEIVNARHSIVHGNAILSSKLNLLISTFVNIIALKLFNIECAMYIPLIGTNVITNKFLDQFVEDNDENAEKRSIEIENKKIKVKKINGKLYLPLELFTPEYNLINEGDEFKILEFQTKENGEDCRLNLKMVRLGQQ